MYKKFVSALYVLNIVFQAFYTLALPIGIGALVSFLLTRYADFPGWIWAVLITLGVFTGLFSMVKFIITAMNNLDRLEKQDANPTGEDNKKSYHSDLRMAENKERDGENHGTE